MRHSVVILLFACCVSGADYDLLIRNARVVDGTGNPWYRADVAVRDGRIAAIGAIYPDKASRVIDAGNRVVAPGFIDVHTHVEGDITKVPRADNFLMDGVTTVITGNCGGSKVNLRDWFTELEKSGIGIN